MSKFEVGQEVIFTKGDLVDVRGIVDTPHYQVSASDWPEVIIQYGEECFFVDIDKVRPAEDPYEYRLYMYSEQNFWFPLGNGWWPLNLVQEDLLVRQDDAYRYNTGRHYKIMKRRKAGEPEDFDGS